MIGNIPLSMLSNTLGKPDSIRALPPELSVQEKMCSGELVFSLRNREI